MCLPIHASRRCIEAVIAQNKPSCPLCRAAIKQSHLIEPLPVEEQQGGSSSGGGASQASQASQASSSAKLEALLAKLREAGAQGIKSIVFSQFTGEAGGAASGGSVQRLLRDWLSVAGGGLMCAPHAMHAPDAFDPGSSSCPGAGSCLGSLSACWPASVSYSPTWSPALPPGLQACT
jgi:hypothetical protein